MTHEVLLWHEGPFIRQGGRSTFGDRVPGPGAPVTIRFLEIYHSRSHGSCVAISDELIEVLQSYPSLQYIMALTPNIHAHYGIAPGIRGLGVVLGFKDAGEAVMFKLTWL